MWAADTPTSTSENGREFYAVVGFTYNFENPDTSYTNGIDSHLDWAASQFLSANWLVGIAGYVYYQLTADSRPRGSGRSRSESRTSIARRIDRPARSATLFEIGGMQAYANVRGYWEFWAQNRVEGYALLDTLSIPLGPQKSKGGSQ